MIMIKVSRYEIVKIIFYTIGLCFTIYSILEFGLIDSHTPPIGFIIPLFIMAFGFLWMIIDWLIVCFSKSIEINFYFNYFGVLINFILVVFIVLDAM